MSIEERDELTVPFKFLTIASLLSVFFAIFFSTKIFRYFSFEKNDISDTIVYYTDALLIQILLFLIVALIGLRLIKTKLLKFSQFICLGIVFGLVVFPVSHFLNAFILKPIFRYSRPVSIAEQFVIGASLNLSKLELLEYNDIATKNIEENLKSFEAKKIFEIIKSDDHEITRIELLDRVKRLNLNRPDKKLLEVFCTSCYENWNKFSIVNIKNIYIPCAIKILKNSKQLAEEPWLTSTIKTKISKFIGTYNNPPAYYWHDSCPSDFALRSTLILLLSITLLIQKKTIRDKIFKNKYWMIIFGGINIIFFLFVLYSRLYIFRHDLNDLGIGAMFGTFIFFLVSPIISRQQLKAKLLFLSMFLFIIIVLTIMYAQDVTKSFVPFFVTLTLLGIWNKLLPSRTTAVSAG